MGIIKMPNFSGSDSKYRPCLQEFYADWAPEKLGTLDDTLIKWEGRVRRQCARLWRAHARAADRVCSAFACAGEAAVCQAREEVQEAGQHQQVQIECVELTDFVCQDPPATHAPLARRSRVLRSNRNLTPCALCVSGKKYPAASVLQRLTTHWVDHSARPRPSSPRQARALSARLLPRPHPTPQSTG